MSKAAQLTNRLAVLERAYHAELMGALRECASGRWGLFGHNEHLEPRAARPAVVEALLDAGLEIARLRKRLGLEPYALHERYLASRGRVADNAPGEPRQAAAWLLELAD